MVIDVLVLKAGRWEGLGMKLVFTRQAQRVGLYESHKVPVVNRIYCGPIIQEAIFSCTSEFLFRKLSIAFSSFNDHVIGQ